MKHAKRLMAYASLLGLSALLTGCGTPSMYRGIKGNVNGIKQEINGWNNIKGTPMKQMGAPVVVHKGFYVNPKPVALNTNPSWMQQTVNLRAQSVPLNNLMGQLLHTANLSVTYGNGVSESTPISLAYHGTVGGALRQIEQATGYHYTSANGGVFWSDFETKTFNIAFMPGSVDYNLGQARAGSTESTNSANGITDTQSSTMSANLSIWKDLDSTLNKLKSDDGQVVVSQATTSVTVHDHPTNVAMIERYVDQMNTLLSEEVTIKVRVLDVQLNKQFQNGINWNILGKTLNTNIALSGSPVGAVSSAISSSLSSDSGLNALTIGSTGSGGSNAIVQALQQQGQVSMVTEPQVTTMNNQVAAIDITRSEGYLKSISSTANDVSTTTSLTPGDVTTGFTMYLLPKIRNNKVYMQISSSMADLIALDKADSSPNDASKSAGDKQGQDYSAIQVPTIDKKQFNQRSVVNNGATLVVAGYRTMNDKTETSKVFGLSALGARGAAHQRIETIILVTPIITRN